MRNMLSPENIGTQFTKRFVKNEKVKQKVERIFMSVAHSMERLIEISFYRLV